jgi:hypothetical protein
MTLCGETVTKQNRYWWLADRIESENDRKETLRRGLLNLLNRGNKSRTVRKRIKTT